MNKIEYVERLRGLIGIIDSLEDSVFENSKFINTVDNFIGEIEVFFESKYKFIKNFYEILSGLQIDIVFIEDQEVKDRRYGWYDKNIDSFLSLETINDGYKGEEFFNKFKQDLFLIKSLNIKRGDNITVLHHDKKEHNFGLRNAVLDRFYMYPETIYTKSDYYATCNLMFAYTLEPNGNIYYSGVRSSFDGKEMIAKA